MAIDAAPSHTGEPVSWCSPTPMPAMARPMMAALSSSSTLFTVGSRGVRR